MIAILTLVAFWLWFCGVMAGYEAANGKSLLFCIFAIAGGIPAGFINILIMKRWSEIDRLLEELHEKTIRVRNPREVKIDGQCLEPGNRRNQLGRYGGR